MKIITIVFSHVNLCRFECENKYDCIHVLPKPCHVGIHWTTLAEHSQVGTHVQGFQSIFRNNFVTAKLATSSMRVKCLKMKFLEIKILGVMRGDF